MVNHNLILKTSIFESLLKIYKTSFYHERKLQEIEVANSYYRHVTPLIKEKAKINRFYFQRIKYTEQMNNEVVSEFISKVENKKVIENYIENTVDLYSDFTDLLIKSLNDASPVNPVSLIACLLKKDENGTIEINNVKYTLIH